MAHGRTKPSKIKTLKARLAYIETVSGEMDEFDKRRPWLKAEMQALEWAIPIVELYTAGKFRRILDSEQPTPIEEPNAPTGSAGQRPEEPS